MNFFCRILFLVLTLPSYVYAGLADSYGFSATGLGRAGTFVADSCGWVASFYNMGGVSMINTSEAKRILGKRREQQVIKANQKKDVGTFVDSSLSSDSYNQISEIGFTYLYQTTQGKVNPDISMVQGQKNRNQVQKNAQIAENSLNYGILQLGMSIDLRPIVSTPYDTPVKLGLALTVRDNGSLASFNDIDPSAYNFLRYGKEAETISVITGLSFQLWKDRLSLGVGGNLGLKGNGTFNITEVSFKINDPKSDTIADFQLPGHEFKTDVRPDFSAVVGFIYVQPIAALHEMRFGGSYKQETEVSVGPISGLATVNQLSIPIGLTFSLLDFYVPNTYSAGLSYRASWGKSDFVFSYDQEFQQWSRASSSDSKILFFKNKSIVLSPLKDVSISKASIEFHPILWPFELRGGYAYQPSFSPEQSGETNFLDNTRHVIAFGFSILFDANFILKNRSRLNFGLQYQKSDVKSVTKASTLDTTNPNPPPNPNYTYSSDVFIFGADFVLIF